MTNTKALAGTILAFVLAVLAASLLWKAICWTSNVDSDTGKPVKTFIIHVEYGANEDMIACPGTPGRVITYTSLENGAADIECAIPR